MSAFLSRHSSRLRSVAAVAIISGIALLTVAVPVAHAQTPAFSITNTTGAGLANPPFTLGFSFTANSSIDVSALGIFDDSQDGLLESHEIGIFDNSGNLLVSTTLGSGTSGTLINQFRYVNVAPVTLSGGATYFVGAVYETGADALIFPGGSTGFTTAPQITYDQSRFGFGSTLTFPSGSGGGGDGYFGPNFRFSPTVVGPPVPEPGAYVTGAFLFGGIGLGLIRGRMRKAKASTIVSG